MRINDGHERAARRRSGLLEQRAAALGHSQSDADCPARRYTEWEKHAHAHATASHPPGSFSATWAPLGGETPGATQRNQAGDILQRAPPHRCVRTGSAASAVSSADAPSCSAGRQRRQTLCPICYVSIALKTRDSGIGQLSRSIQTNIQPISDTAGSCSGSSGPNRDT